MSAHPALRGLALSAATLTLTCLLLEVLARLLAPDPAPYRLRDGLYASALPQIAGVALPLQASVPRDAPRLAVEKDPKELRIFVFGESSVAGVPFSIAQSSSAMLLDLLKNGLPGKKPVVVNMGRIGALAPNTLTYLLAMRRFHPDVVVFYLGINDSAAGGLEEGMPARSPRLHAIWRWLLGHSQLVWLLRVHGPHWLPQRPAPSGQAAKAPQGPPPGFGRWTDLLTETAVGMGAQVLVTTPLRTAMAELEPGLVPAADGSVAFAGLTPEYRALLACRLDPACDFAGVLARHFADAQPLALQRHRAWLDALGAAWQAGAQHFGAHFVDLRTALEQRSPGHLLGARFFMDEVHLTLEGYAVQARLWDAQIRALLADAPPQPIAWPTPADLEPYQRLPCAPTAMGWSFLKRGWYLCAIPSLQAAVAMCPGPQCDGGKAASGLAWLKDGLTLSARPDPPRSHPPAGPRDPGGR